ncbi:MAG: hypothetical protein ACLQGP_16020 [Isosphaeraceae bacterium]
MAANDPSDGAGKEHQPEIAAADLLFRDDPVKKLAKDATDAAPVGQWGEVFDLAPPLTHEPESPSATSPDPNPAPPRPAPRPREAAPRKAAEPSREDPADLVEEVWSRQGEWGPTLLIVAGWLFGLAVFLYIALGILPYSLSFLALLAGCAGAVILSYPILITLERPIRMTPEQALRDFYAALSHHVPHFRRMWLLLGKKGRITPSFGSFEGFKAYWSERLRKLKGSQAGPMTPLVFEIENYRGEKSAGQTRVDVQFTLKVSVRGQRQAGPIGTFPARISLVRGPDNMWYLESGTLPETPRERKPIES